LALAGHKKGRMESSRYVIRMHFCFVTDAQFDDYPGTRKSVFTGYVQLAW
jgi:hypothetical protein